MKLKTYQEVEAYLLQFVPKTSKWGEPSFAYKRSQHVVTLLGDPQNELKVIHVAGTSGKGSTSYMLSALLHSQGLKVGMGISPHIVNILERIQINGNPISEELFVFYMNEIMPRIEEMKASEFGPPTYFEIIVGLSYYIFLKEGVDVVVMETGLGGRWCATNVATAPNKISVITRIGYDHMEFLGTTLPQIATEKAKIIQPSNLALKLEQESEVMNVFEKEAEEKKAQLIKVNPDDIISEKNSSLLGLTFTFDYQDIHLKALKLSLIGEFQFENAAVALTTFVEFMKREGQSINESKLRNALGSIRIPGRMELKTINDREMIIDSAHNPQKMESFITSLTHTFPQEKFTFLLSFKKGKDYDQILKYITPHAEEIVVTSFDNKNQGMGELYSENPETIAELLKKDNFYRYTVISDLQEAFDSVQKSKSMVIITGSLYLVGEIYKLMEK